MTFTLEQRKAIALAKARKAKAEHEAKLAEQAPKPERASIEDQMLQIPGMSAVAELASAANKSIFQFLDFVGADNVNAVLDLVGSDKKVPTLTETFGSDGGYMEEGLGRDVAQAVGKTLPVALGAGQAMRSVASKLPGAVASESAGAGVVRQMGQSTAKQDAVAGALSATGGELGEEVAGADGKLIGSVVAPLASAGPALVKSSIKRQTQDKALELASPSVGQLKEQSSKIYDQLESSGVRFNRDKFGALVEGIVSKVGKEGFNSRLHPKVGAVIDELANHTKKSLSFSEADTLRKVAGTAAKSIEPDEARLGRIIIDKLDDFLENTSRNAVEGQGEEVGKLASQARSLWARARKTEMIEEAVERAGNQATGIENGLRTQFRSILNNKKKIRSFSEEEKAAIRKVVQGGRAENVAKLLGKFGFSEGQATSALLGSLGIAGGAAVGGPGGAVVVPAAGQFFKKVAQRLTVKNSKLAAAVAASGNDGRKIVAAYFRAIPKKERDMAELTGLLIEGKIPLEGLKRSKDELIANAAYFASVLSQSGLPGDESIPKVPSAEKDELKSQD